MVRRPIGEWLIELDVINDLDLDAALATQPEALRLGQHLVDLGLCEEADIIRGLSRQLGVPGVLLGERFVDTSLAGRIPARLARELRVAPLAVLETSEGPVLRVAMADPRDSEAIERIERIAGMEVDPVVAGDRSLDRIIEHLYPRTATDLEFVQSVPTADELGLSK